MAKLWIMVLIVALALAAFYVRGPATTNGSTLMLGKTRVNAEVADTVEKQVQGLSGRPNLAKNSGMLFIFRGPSRPSFWMKDMKFPLDFIWIANGRVVEITANVPHEPGVADQDLKRYTPSQPVDAMLEISGGWAALNGIKVGDEARRLEP